MNTDNDTYLCKTFPKLFANRNKDMTETAMCWGFDCGDGWFNIINQLCINIQHHIDWQNENASKGYKQYTPVQQVVVDQVKEKFGTLRFYYTGGNDYVRGLVSMAESMSGVTCEECGNIASINYPEDGGWVITICDPCQEKRSQAYAKYREEETKK